MALCRLVMFARDYWRGDYDSDQVRIPDSLKPPKRHASVAEKESWNEHEEAVRIARAILAYNDINHLEPVQRLHDVDNLPIGWNVVGDEGIQWADTGSEYIFIPKFPRF